MTKEKSHHLETSEDRENGNGFSRGKWGGKEKNSVFPGRPLLAWICRLFPPTCPSHAPAHLTPAPAPRGALVFPALCCDRLDAIQPSAQWQCLACSELGRSCGSLNALIICFMGAAAQWPRTALPFSCRLLPGLLLSLVVQGELSLFLQIPLSGRQRSKRLSHSRPITSPDSLAWTICSFLVVLLVGVSV